MRIPRERSPPNTVCLIKKIPALDFHFMSTAVVRNIIKFEILSSICASIKIIFHI